MSFFFLLILVKDLSVFFTFSKNQLLVLLIFSNVYLAAISFIIALIFLFFLLTLASFFLPFSSLLNYQFKSFIWDFFFCLSWGRLVPLWTLIELVGGIPSVSSVQSLSHFRLFQTPRTVAHQASLSITNSQSSLKLMSIESVMPSNHLILYCSLLLLLSIFPSIQVFPMSQLFASDGQSIGASASASVLQMNIQDWFPLGWTGLISLQSKGLTRVFSNARVQKHQFFSAQLSCIPLILDFCVSIFICHQVFFLISFDLSICLLVI